MASACIPSCAQDADAPIPVRAGRPTYVRIQKPSQWNEDSFRSPRFGPRPPRAVDSISCRQMYLRSYTFSRKESVREKTVRCLGMVKERAALVKKGGSVIITTTLSRLTKRSSLLSGKKTKCLIIIRKAEINDSCASLSSVFWRLLSCTRAPTVDDVADDHDDLGD